MIKEIEPFRDYLHYDGKDTFRIETMNFMNWVLTAINMQTPAEILLPVVEDQIRKLRRCV